MIIRMMPEEFSIERHARQNLLTHAYQFRSTLPKP